MRQLRPVTIIALGPLLLGVAMTSTFFAVEPDTRNVLDVLIVFAIGAAVGLVLFAPISFAVRFDSVIRVWLAQYGSRVRPIVGLVMALGLGYLIASVRYQSFDVIALIAIGCVFTGAMFGVIIGIVAKESVRVPP